MTRMTRRSMLATTGGAALTAALGGSIWRAALATGPEVTVGSRYGPLLGPDPSGLRLPAGFTGRAIARSGDVVPGTSLPWHAAPDGGACFSRDGGGWRYVSNSEVGGAGGGASVIEFAADATITRAYPVLSGTSRNCAGGPTPWGTWLSCEESGDGGHVWECDVSGPGSGTRRPALGAFNHEAAVIDPVTGAVYLTEDRPTGRLYRFHPSVAGDLAAGSLEAAVIDGDPSSAPAAVRWRAADPDAPDRSPATTPFDGGEGAWIHDRHLLFTTKGDRRVWELDLDGQTITVLHDCVAEPDTPLDAVDNVVVHHRTGDIFVAEDGGNMELCSIERRPDGGRRVGAFLRIDGHDASEVTGPAFSPDGRRLYVSSQRGADGRGITYDITGPFHQLDLDSPPSGPLHRAERLGPAD